MILATAAMREAVIAAPSPSPAPLATEKPERVRVHA